MQVIYDKEKQRVPIFSWCEDIEASVLEQAINMSNHPAAFHNVSLMPDAHTGMGVPIGGVMALDGTVCPAAVGVDIGCGMCSIRTGYKVEAIKDKLKDIRSQIMREIPVGFSHREKGPLSNKKISDKIIYETCQLHKKHELHRAIFFKDVPKVDDDAIITQIATLGGGNHFIEIQKDEQDIVWIMIHSGSRNIGLQIAKHYHKKAIALNKKWHSVVPDKELSFLPTDSEEGKEYIQAMTFALEFAFLNRKLMMYIIAEIFEEQGFKLHKKWQQGLINIHHNYASLENHYGKNVVVHRKGATLARKGTIGIIPGSMGTNSYIVEGLGSPKSFMSCSHGAGRLMSRTKAKKTIEIEKFIEVMKDIEYDPSEASLDEAPQAYKNIDEVMANQSDLVAIKVKLSPLAVVKGE